MEKINGDSMNIVEDNILKLKEIFPEVFCEDKVDFERLQEVLGNYIEDKEERYRFEWNGKSKAIRTAQTPSTGTLRPCKAESKNWDTTQNLYIEGDNLEVLKLLQKSYQNKIKLINIDPPYNTGSDFIYKDDYKDNIWNYLAITGQVDDDGRKVSSNSEVSGRYHTDWLNMIYPRIRLAKNLLSSDGIIVMHIDEHEFVNVNKVMEEIFGEENNLGEIVWDKRNPKGDSKGIACQHEYIIIYAKNKEDFLKDTVIKRPKKNANKIIEKSSQLWKEYKSGNCLLEDVNRQFKKWMNEQNDFSGGEKAYCNIDINGDVFRPVSMAWPNKKKAPEEYWIPLIHPITKKDCPVPARGWRNPPKTMKDLLDKGLILFGNDETVQPNRKYLLKENMYENVPSLIYYGGSDDKLLEGLEIPFDTPKVVDVSAELISMFTKNDDIVLDFFAGSCTVAHSVMKLNYEKQSERKFIMVQLPESIDEKSEAFSKGFKNICEIGKKRIKRAGEKIVGVNKEISNCLDIGFKVLKLDSSNIKKWNPDYDNLNQSFDDMLENFVPNRTEEDVVYEIMLKYGIDLTYPVEERVIIGKKVFSIGFGALIICLDDNISLEVINGIVAIKEELAPEVCRVVFKDNGFATDSVKTNAIQILRRNNIHEVMSI